MMKIYRPALALLLLAGAALPVMAAEPASKPATTQESDDDEEAITCEHEGVTGSRVKKKTVCMSEKSRREQRERTGEALDDIRIQGTAQRANGG